MFPSHLQIILASTSDIKHDAVEEFISELYSNFQIETINCDKLGLPSQPIDCGESCTYQRALFVRNNYDNCDDCLIIAIENDIVKEDNSFYDRAHTRLEFKSIAGVGVSQKFHCPVSKNFDQQKLIVFDPNNNIKGYNIEASAFMNKPIINTKNWMLEVLNIDRKDQIIESLEKAFLNLEDNLHNDNAHK